MPIISASPGNTPLRLAKTWGFLLIIMLFVIFVRVRLLDFPLERDEGEYAYMGQLILQGIPPYSEAYNMKLPGTSMIYALIMSLFGQTVQGIHLGFMAVNCITILLVSLLAKKLISGGAALAAGGTYAVLSLSSTVFGFAAHATHFVVLTALGGILVLLSALDKNTLKAYFASGVLLGLSFLMKQPGIFFFIFSAVYVLYHYFSSSPSHPLKRLILNLGIFSFGAAVPLLAVLVWIYSAGVFDRFWFWTVEYASQYGSQIPLSDAFAVFRQQFPPVTGGFFILWILAALGFVAMFFHQGLKVNRGFVLLFSLFSFFSICPGFYFREHYFVTLLPAVSILVGVFIDFLSSGGIASFKPAVLKFTGIAIFAAAALSGIISQSGYFFRDDPVKLSRTFYGPNPFPESLPIAEYIRARSGAADKIAVFGSEPQIFFYANRHSSSGYIYTYSLMEKHAYSREMQKEMITEVESSKPKFLILVHVSTSWLIRPESEMYIFGWLDNFTRNNYDLVGVVDIISPEITVFKWQEDAAKYTPKSTSYLLVYERR